MAAEFVTRGFGLLIDQEHGLLPSAPIYLLILPGALILSRTQVTRLCEACLLVAAYCVPVLLPSVNAHGWDGGWSPAARFLVPITPILIVVAFGYVARIRRWPSALVVLFLAQVLLALVYWSHPKVLWNLGTGKSALATFLSPPGLDLAQWLPCWHTPSFYAVGSSLLAVAIWTLVSIRAVANKRLLE
jgi:hypothetical protein